MTQLNRGNLAAMSNPNGAGVVVSITYRGDGAGFRETVRRTGWLVLNDMAYPIDVEAAKAFGLLLDGYPADVRAAAGVGSGAGFDEFGLGDIVAFNADTKADADAFMQAGNELCKAATGLGR